MGILHDNVQFKATSVVCTASDLIVMFEDGRKLSTPLAWYPRLEKAKEKELSHYEINAYGIHWPEIDEDLSFEGMFNGRKAY